MAFIMHGYAKNSIGTIACLCLLIPVVKAQSPFVNIEQAELTYTKKNVALAAKLKFQLSVEATKALRSGIKLYWNIDVVFRQDQWLGLWTKELAAYQDRYRLSYHTLLDNYRVQVMNERTARRFLYLVDALNYMAKINYKYLLSDLAIDEEYCLLTSLQVSFDREALPVPLRPFAYFNQAWDLSTDVRQWCD